MEKETQTLKARLGELKAFISNEQKKTSNAKQFAELVSDYTDITELSESLLNVLVE